MMRVAVVALACVSAFGCVSAIECESSASCPTGGVCDPQLKICVTEGDAGASGGGGGAVLGGGGGSTGGGGGGATGGGGGGGCVLTTCADGQECGASNCQDTAVEIVVTSQPTTVGTSAQRVSGRIQRTGMAGVVTGLKLPLSVNLTPAPALFALTPAASAPVALDGTFSFDVAALPAANGAGTVRTSFGAQPVFTDVALTADTTGPVLTIDTLPMPPAGAFDGGLDTRVPTGPAHRKDETVTVRVRSSHLDTAVGTISLRAQHLTDAAATPTASGDCSTTGVDVCRVFQLDLSRLEMKAFRGNVSLTASAQDALGNAGTSMASTVTVSRFNWARYLASSGTTSGVLVSTPAIGSGGRVYVPVANGTAAGMVGLDPDGTVSWSNAAGAVAGVPVIGQSPANGELLLYQLATGGGSVRTQIIGGSTGATCDPGMSGTSSEGGLVMVGSDTSDLGAIGLQFASTDLFGRMTLPLNLQQCTPTTTGLLKVARPGNMVANANSVFFVDESNDLKRLDYTLGATPTLTQGGTVTNINPGVGVVNGLAMLSGTRIAGGGGPGIGKLFAFEIDGGVAWPSPTPLSGPTSGPAIRSGAVFAQYKQGTASLLLRVNAATGVLVESLPLAGSSFSGTEIATPTLGEDGNIYAVDTTGRLFVVQRNFAADAGVEWSAPLPSGFGGLVKASPTLDCSRRPGAAGGTLYLATDEGWLLSYVVDAQGLDTTAVWPKYARDARNSGNINGPVISCP